LGVEGVGVGGGEVVGLLAVGVDVGDDGGFEAGGEGGVEGAIDVEEEDGGWC